MYAAGLNGRQFRYYVSPWFPSCCTHTYLSGARFRPLTALSLSPATHPDRIIRGAEALDWNIRGRIGPGLQRPGLQKEEEAAAARNSKENMNKNEEQEREDTKNKSREKGGEGEEGEADESVEPGLEHPGKKCTRTGTSGAAAPNWNVRGRYGPGLERPGLHKGEEVTEAGRKGKEKKNKGKMRRREDRPRVVKGEGKERTESKENLQSTKEKGGRHGASGWDNRGPEEDTQRRGWRPGTGTSGGTQADKSTEQDWSGSPGRGQPEKKGKRPGKDRPGLSKEEEAAAANKAGDMSRGTKKRNERCERIREDEGTKQKEATGKARRREKDGKVPRDGTSGEKGARSRRGKTREEEGRRGATAAAGTGLWQREGMEDVGLGGREEPRRR